MSFRQLFRTILTGAAITGAALAQTTTTNTTVTRQSSYAPTGLATSETAQVNVTNTATASSNGTAASCTGTISFLNSSGTAIGTATSFTVTSGQTFSVTLPFSKVGASGSRTVIRGVISLTETSGVPCELSWSMETYDSTSGASHTYQAGGGIDLGGGPSYGPGNGH